jgi:hypothetical protein
VYSLAVKLWVAGIAVWWGISLAFVASAQTTFNNTGNWNIAGNWAGNNIGDLLTENVSISNNKDPTVANGDNYTVGDVTAAGTTTLTINAGGTLSIGQAGTPKDLTFNNNSGLVVAGTLYIFGDLIVGNSLSLTITGTVHIYGNIDLGNSGSLNVSGGLVVDGNVTGGNNTNISVSGGGSIDIGGDLNTGNTSSITGPAGSVTVGGSCNSTTPGFCSSSTLPIELIFFKASQERDVVEVSWATATEINVDYFAVEKSVNGTDFEELGRVKGNALSTERVTYCYTDFTPLSGSAYYRLKEVDLDGFTKYFHVVHASTSLGNQSWIYPNPVTEGKATLQLNFVPSGVAIVTDPAGVELLRVPLHGLKTDLSLPFSAGTYLVRVESGVYRRTNRIVLR